MFNWIARRIMGNGYIVDADDTTWGKAVEKEKNLVVVMFFSPVCPHCQTMEPYFNEYSKNFQNKAIFVRVNVMNSPAIVDRYGIMGTPTFKFFCQGQPVKEIVGAMYPSILKQAIEDALKHGHDCIKKSTKISDGIPGYA
jgi:thiol-disulfide isomerase/thioredoxin